jgi:hypothetical protein
MSLQIVQGRRTANPGIACDHCGQPITNGKDGNYQWRPTDEGETTTVYFTHKRCCHAFEHLHPGPWCAIGLAWLLPFLAHNLAVDVKRTAAEIKMFNW